MILSWLDLMGFTNSCLFEESNDHFFICELWRIYNCVKSLLYWCFFIHFIHFLCVRLKVLYQPNWFQHHISFLNSWPSKQWHHRKFKLERYRVDHSVNWKFSDKGGIKIIKKFIAVDVFKVFLYNFFWTCI